MDFEKKVLGWEYYNHAAIAVTRNPVLTQAKGKWIAFLDCENLCVPPKIEKQLKFMVENGYAFCYTHYEKIGENNKTNGIFPETLASYRKKSGSISNSYAFLIMWLYVFYREAEVLNPIRSLWITMRNLFFCVWENIKYVRSFQQILTVRMADKRLVCE